MGTHVRISSNTIHSNDISHRQTDRQTHTHTHIHTHTTISTKVRNLHNKTHTIGICLLSVSCRHHLDKKSSACAFGSAQRDGCHLPKALVIGEPLADDALGLATDANAK